MAINYELLAQKAADIRVDIIREVHAAASGHPGGSVSASDIVTVLYFHEMNIDPADPKKEDRDKFVLSKGPAAPVQPVAPVQPQVQKRNVLLCLRTGPMAGRIYSCPNGAPVVIGRNPSRSNLALSQYGKVSSAHCRLECTDGVLRVTDLGSTNGTFIGTQRVTTPTPLVPGVQVRIGQSVVELQR